MTSTNERSRPEANGAAFPKSFGGDTHILPRQADIEALDALLTSESAMYEAGFRDGHAAGLLESDQRVSDSVRRMLHDLRNGGLL